MSKKRPIVAAIEKEKGARSSSSKKASLEGGQVIPSSTTLPLWGTDVVLLEQWVKDHIIILLELEFLPSLAKQNDAKYYSIIK